MELDQKFNFRFKNSKNVASLPDQDFSNTVLLFESRISYPALRVTSNNNLFRDPQPRRWLAFSLRGAPPSPSPSEGDAPRGRPNSIRRIFAKFAPSVRDIEFHASDRA